MAAKVRRFVRHYVEMVLAMLVGMMLLYPVWMLATSGAGEDGVLRSVEVDALVMATTMAAPMAAWMRFRGHGWAPTVEMSAAMYAGFVVMLPLHWAGAADADGVLVVGHVLMFALMAVAMAWRWEEYTGHCHRSGPDAPATVATP